MTLEHVALNQTRFNTPGVAPDNRGVLCGKQGALLFSSVDRLVGFFRVFCDESSMDDLLPKLKIHQVRTPLESREHLVLFHASTSYLLDRAARIANLFGGLSFTGSGKHYVKYRDNASPLGYDAAALHTDGADFVLYADTFTQGYQRVKDVPFEQLVFRLSLRAAPRRGKDELDPLGGRELLWLTARQGLSRSLLVYLWRNRVRAEAARIEPQGGESTFGQGGALLLVRAHELPERMVSLFRQVPGLEVHRPVGDNCIVELGFHHPFRLESCASVFDKDKFYVFSGTRDAVDVLQSPPPLVPGHDLIGGGFDLGARSEPRPVTPAQPEKLEVELKLVPALSARRRVTATLVGWAQAAWLKRMVYALPPTLLAGYRVAAIPEGLFVIGEQGIDGLPLGELFQEAGPSIYVPVGYELLPRVGAQVLSEHLGGVASRYVVFPLGAKAPLSLDHGLFEPLGRRALARLEVEPRARDPRLPPPRTVTPASVVNEGLGALPLWGFHGEPKRG
ncbi:MAG: hypothetical protein ACHQ17_01790 [Polyangia bacterium]